MSIRLNFEPCHTSVNTQAYLESVRESRRLAVPKLTIEEVACLYARQLGHDDYPAMGECPYNRAKSPHLHSSYWKGWKAAAANDGVIARRYKGRGRSHSTNAY